MTVTRGLAAILATDRDETSETVLLVADFVAEVVGEWARSLSWRR